MKKTLLTVIYLAAAIPAFAQLSDKATLTIGSEVPDYPEVQWVKGTPVNKFDKDKIYIIECWATWCHPCVQSIPHLNELNKKFGDKIVIIGQNVWEDGKDKVEKFVQDKGDDMSYTVAFSGGNQSQFADKWLKPAGVNGIPATFVIQDNRIVWQPHPMELSDEALQMLIDRKFTVEAANAFNPLIKMEEVQKLMKENKLDEADAKLAALLSKDPNSEGLNYMKLALLQKQGKNKEALAYAKNYYDRNPGPGQQFYFEALLKAEEYDQLLTLTDLALKKDPEDVQTIILRYQVLSKQKDAKSAAAMIRKLSGTNDSKLLTTLAAINHYVENGLTDPEVEKAKMDAGVKALSIDPTDIKAMITVAGAQWKTDKSAAKATAARTTAAMKSDPQKARMANIAALIQASLDKDVFPDDKQIESWYDAEFNKK